MARPTTRGDQRGVALLALLLVIAAMAATLAAGGTLWHEVQQREKERELVFVGMQYRNAIRQYYLNSAGSARYPPTLDALLRDERLPQTRRYLRRLYLDPLTNSSQWGLVNAPGGGIMGVYSLATEVPIKRANFPAELGWTADKATYAEWQFVYVPSVAPVVR
jgi:type II secretory pathway pseudopilin PulG